jgi:hypothetical protein
MIYIRCRTSRSHVRNTIAAAWLRPLFTATKRIVGVGLADYFSISRIILLRFTKGFT